MPPGKNDSGARACLLDAGLPGPRSASLPATHGRFVSCGGSVRAAGSRPPGGECTPRLRTHHGPRHPTQDPKLPGASERGLRSSSGPAVSNWSLSICGSKRRLWLSGDGWRFAILQAKRLHLGLGRITVLTLIKAQQARRPFLGHAERRARRQLSCGECGSARVAGRGLASRILAESYRGTAASRSTAPVTCRAVPMTRADVGAVRRDAGRAVGAPRRCARPWPCRAGGTGPKAAWREHPALLAAPGSGTRLILQTPFSVKRSVGDRGDVSGKMLGVGCLSVGRRLGATLENASSSVLVKEM